MVNDHTTFMLAFFAIFGIIITYIYRLNKLANRLAQTASDKNDDESAQS